MVLKFLNGMNTARKRTPPRFEIEPAGPPAALSHPEEYPNPAVQLGAFASV
jgi:hypothetical protein